MVPAPNSSALTNFLGSKWQALAILKAFTSERFQTSVQDSTFSLERGQQSPIRTPTAATLSRSRRGAAVLAWRSRCGTTGRCRELPAAPEPPREASRCTFGRDLAHLKVRPDRTLPAARTADLRRCAVIRPRAALWGRCCPPGPCQGAAVPPRRSRYGPPVDAGAFGSFRTVNSSALTDFKMASAGRFPFSHLMAPGKSATGCGFELVFFLCRWCIMNYMHKLLSTSYKSSKQSINR